MQTDATLLASTCCVHLYGITYKLALVAYSLKPVQAFGATIPNISIVLRPATGADPGGGQHCLGHGQIFGRAKQLFCLLVLLLVFGCGPTSGDTLRFVGCDTARFVGWIRPWAKCSATMLANG